MPKVSGLIAIILLTTGAVAAQTRVSAGHADVRPGRVEEKTGRVEEKRSAARRDDSSVRVGRVLRLGPTSIYLKNGLRADEVVRLMGRPLSVSERREGDARLGTYRFSRSEGRVLIAEFVNGILVNSRTENPAELVRAAAVK
ncbi:MAG TPA: hypothetical protein VF723_13190 [Pyrinomonadaceae bacterium]|jgi:hypothetical protein